jgi:hypothetical protein
LSNKRFIHRSTKGRYAVMPMPPQEPSPADDALHPRNIHPSPRRHGASKTFSALTLSIVMLVSLLSGTVLAAGGPPDGTGSGDDGMGPGGPGPGPRHMNVDVEPYRAQVRTTLKNGQDGDEIGYDIETQNQLRIQLRFQSEGGDTQKAVRMTVAFQRIVEYEDDDGDGELGAGDEVVSTYDLEGAEYGQLQYQTRETLDGKDEEVITASTSDGVFTMVSHFVQTQARIRSGELAPNWVKMDFIIEDYPYQRTTTRLALRTQLQTECPVTVVRDPLQREYMGDGEGAVECDQEGVASFYSWKRSAEVDGADAPVRARVSAEEGGTHLYFSYERGDSINHDPKLGLPIVDGAIGDGTFDLLASLIPYIGAIAIGAVVIGASVAARKRRNGLN